MKNIDTIFNIINQFNLTDSELILLRDRINDILAKPIISEITNKFKIISKKIININYQELENDLVIITLSNENIIKYKPSNQSIKMIIFHDKNIFQEQDFNLLNTNSRNLTLHSNIQYLTLLSYISDCSNKNSDSIKVKFEFSNEILNAIINCNFEDINLFQLNKIMNDNCYDKIDNNIWKDENLVINYENSEFQIINSNGLMFQSNVFHLFKSALDFINKNRLYDVLNKNDKDNELLLENFMNDYNYKNIAKNIWKFNKNIIKYEKTFTFKNLFSYFECNNFNLFSHLMKDSLNY
jgi:hypothetical protein